MSGPIQTAIAFGLLGILALGALWRPPIALAAVLCVFGLKQWGQAASPWLAVHGTFTNYAVGVMVILALVRHLLRGQCALCNVSTSNWLVISLYGYAALSLLWTPRPDLVGDIWVHDFPYVLTFVLVAPLLVSRASDLQKPLAMTIFVGGIIVVGLLFFGKWGDRGLIVGAGSGHEEESNPLAIATVAGAVGSAAMYLHSQHFKMAGRLIRFAIVAACLGVIIRSGSRGQLIGFVLSLVVFMPVAFRLSQLRSLAPIAVGLTVMAVTAQFAAQQFIHSDDSRWDKAGAAEAAAGRLSMSLALLSKWSESPGSVIFGLGNSASFDPAIVGFYPHNVPAETLGEEGLIGFGLYVALMWVAASGALRTMRLARDNPEIRGLLAALCANFLFSLITSMKEGNMLSSVFYFLSAILLARMPELIGTRATVEAAPTPASERAPSGPLYANLMR